MPTTARSQSEGSEGDALVAKRSKGRITVSVTEETLEESPEVKECLKALIAAIGKAADKRKNT